MQTMMIYIAHYIIQDAINEASVNYLLCLNLSITISEHQFIPNPFHCGGSALSLSLFDNLTLLFCFNVDSAESTLKQKWNCCEQKYALSSQGKAVFFQSVPEGRLTAAVAGVCMCMTHLTSGRVEQMATCGLKPTLSILRAVLPWSTTSPRMFTLT